MQELFGASTGFLPLGLIGDVQCDDDFLPQGFIPHVRLNTLPSPDRHEDCAMPENEHQASAGVLHVHAARVPA